MNEQTLGKIMEEAMEANWISSSRRQTKWAPADVEGSIMAVKTDRFITPLSLDTIDVILGCLEAVIAETTSQRELDQATSAKEKVLLLRGEIAQ